MAEVRRQDQVPLQNQDNNPVESTSLEQSPAHEPLLHTRTSLEDAVAQRALKGMDKVTGDLGIPDRIPRGLVENPDAGGAREVVPADKKKSPWVKRGVATVAGALAISVGAGIVHYKNTKEAFEDSPLNVGGGDRIATAPAVPGDVRTEKYPARLPIGDVTGDQFVGTDTMYPYKYTRQEQLDYAGAKLNTDMQGTAERMRDRIGRQYSDFTGDDGKTTRTIVTPALSNTPQQILDQLNVGGFQAWETAQNGNIEEAKKLAAVVADPTHREYSDQIKLFSDSRPNATDGIAWNEKPIISNGEYEGITATPGAPLIEFTINNGSNDSGDRVNAVFRFEQGSSADSARWVLVTTHDA